MSEQPGWVGWCKSYRDGKRRWLPAVQATTEAQAWHLLLAVPRQGQSDLVVLPSGRHPADPAPVKGRPAGKTPTP